jgi:hypothetical protein
MRLSLDRLAAWAELLLLLLLLAFGGPAGARSAVVAGVPAEAMLLVLRVLLVVRERKLAIRKRVV